MSPCNKKDTLNSLVSINTIRENLTLPRLCMCCSSSLEFSTTLYQTLPLSAKLQTGSQNPLLHYTKPSLIQTLFRTHCLSYF